MEVPPLTLMGGREPGKSLTDLPFSVPATRRRPQVRPQIGPIAPRRWTVGLKGRAAVGRLEDQAHASDAGFGLHQLRYVHRDHTPPFFL